MAKIITKECIAPAVYEMVVDAPLVAHKCHPGQFVIVRTDEFSERVPLTIADFDREKGTITLIIQAVGNSTHHLCETFNVGDDILDVVGPLGRPSEMEKFGTVVVVGGGIGTEGEHFARFQDGYGYRLGRSRRIRGRSDVG